MIRKCWLMFSSLAVLALLLVGCVGSGSGGDGGPDDINPPRGTVWDPIDGANTPPTGPGNPDPEAPKDVPLRVGDLVKIIFSGVASPPDPHQENIREDGNITLLYNVVVKAAGKTPGQLQEDIRKAYVPKIFRHLNVVVMSDSRVYYVGGEVRVASKFPYTGPITFLRAIDTAGGLTEYSNRKKVLLQRFNGQELTINYDKAQKNPELDLAVYPGDRIFVPSRFY